VPPRPAPDAVPAASVPPRGHAGRRATGAGSGLGRTGALAVLLLASAPAAILHVLRWPDSAPALDCPEAAVGWVDGGSSPVARCGAGGALPPDVARSLGRSLDLNQVPEEALARLPGIGARAAHELVEARARSPFRTWDEVNAVPGIGPVRLATLRRFTVLGP